MKSLHCILGLASICIRDEFRLAMDISFSYDIYIAPGDLGNPYKLCHFARGLIQSRDHARRLVKLRNISCSCE